LVRLDPSGAITDTLDVGPEPRGLAIDGDGSRAWVARFRSGESGGEVREVDLASFAVRDVIPLALDTTTVDGDDRARGLPNYLRQAVLAPDGARVWVPSKKDNVLRGLFRDGRELTFETTVRTIASRIDPATGAEVRAEQIDFDNRDSASAVAFSPLGDYAFVALQGSAEIDIRDTYSGLQAGAITEVGFAPQGLAPSPDGRTLFVQSFLSR
ncbi:MAG: hypothetical protein KDB37_22635, partial [Ilumatobacter sp.]|nr:hypothetical protein [Ilumatobacter sp.]